MIKYTKINFKWVLKMNLNVNKFNEKSEFYNKYRPNYSNELVDCIVSELNSLDDCIADIGCGTGIFTKQLVERNCKVIGIEPNLEMYEKAKNNLPGIKVINSTSEDTTLDSNSINIITVAQALHWFNIDEFVKEAKRILKQDGKIAIVYNIVDDSKDVVKEFKYIHENYCENHNNHNRNFDELFESIFGDNYILKEFSNNQKYTYEEFMGYESSMSYSLTKEDNRYNEYIESLNNLFNKYSKDGILELPMNSKLAFGKIK